MNRGTFEERATHDTQNFDVFLQSSFSAWETLVCDLIQEDADKKQRNYATAQKQAKGQISIPAYRKSLPGGLAEKAEHARWDETNRYEDVGIFLRDGILHLTCVPDFTVCHVKRKRIRLFAPEYCYTLSLKVELNAIAKKLIVGLKKDLQDAGILIKGISFYAQIYYKNGDRAGLSYLPVHLHGEQEEAASLKFILQGRYNRFDLSPLPLQANSHDYVALHYEATH